MEEFNKLKNYVEKIGQDVENFQWKLSFNGTFWSLEIESEFIDGEEQYFDFNNHSNLEDLLEELKETF